LNHTKQKSKPQAAIRQKVKLSLAADLEKFSELGSVLEHLRGHTVLEVDCIYYVCLQFPHEGRNKTHIARVNKSGETNEIEAATKAVELEWTYTSHAFLKIRDALPACQ